MNRDAGIGKFISLAFGSDEVTPYSAEYSWNSNQVAHIMMGFCLASCWLVAAMTWRRLAETGEFDPNADPAWKAWLLWVARRFASIKLDVSVAVLFLLIPLKEVLDMALDASSFSGSTIQPNWKRLLFDSLTDIGHWWTGMFFAALIVGTVSGFFKGPQYAYRPIIALVGFAGCLIYLIAWARPMWQEQKRVFDRSNLPGNYYRLVSLEHAKEEKQVHIDPKSEIQWKQLEEFRAGVVDAEDRPPQKHVIIIGGAPGERSRLAVAMACEHAFKIRNVNRELIESKPIRCRYFTATALLERMRFMEGILADPKLECVVIDDFDVSIPPPKLTPSSSDTLVAAIEQHAMNTKRNPTISKTVLDRYKVDVGPAAAADKKPGVVEFNASRIDSAKKKGKIDRPPTPDDDPLVIQRHAVVFGLGGQVNDKNISTIWVLAGRTEGMTPELLEKWNKRRAEWIEAIGIALGLADPKKELSIIELAPPTDEIKK